MSRAESPSRMHLTLLLLGHFCVFLIAMLHDELVAEMVEEGWIAPAHSGLAEMAIGTALFVVWSLLLVRLFTLMQRAAGADETTPGKGE